VHLGGARETVEERLADQPVVRLAVRRWDDPLVDPPQVDTAPVRPQDRDAFVCRARARAAGEADVTAPVDRCGDPLYGGLGRRLGIVEDNQLDVRQRSPSASSFERSIAA
jgi:hypothetical protein